MTAKKDPDWKTVSKEDARDKLLEIADNVHSSKYPKYSFSSYVDRTTKDIIIRLVPVRG